MFRKDSCTSGFCRGIFCPFAERYPLGKGIIMRTVDGIYASAKIFSNTAEDYAVAQIRMICDNEVSRGSQIRGMPDVHPGQVGPIGLTMTVGERILPQLIGIDIMNCVNVRILDEAPFAYRNLQEIAEAVSDTIRIDQIIRPVYNFKADGK